MTPNPLAKGSLYEPPESSAAPWLLRCLLLLIGGFALTGIVGIALIVYDEARRPRSTPATVMVAAASVDDFESHPEVVTMRQAIADAKRALKQTTDFELQRQWLQVIELNETAISLTKRQLREIAKVKGQP